MKGIVHRIQALEKVVRMAHEIDSFECEVRFISGDGKYAGSLLLSKDGQDWIRPPKSLESHEEGGHDDSIARKKVDLLGS